MGKRWAGEGQPRERKDSLRMDAPDRPQVKAPGMGPGRHGPPMRQTGPHLRQEPGSGCHSASQRYVSAPQIGLRGVGTSRRDMKSLAKQILEHVGVRGTHMKLIDKHPVPSDDPRAHGRAEP
jgi:hypothetical protein